MFIAMLANLRPAVVMIVTSATWFGNPQLSNFRYHRQQATRWSPPPICDAVGIFDYAIVVAL